MGLTAREYLKPTVTPQCPFSAIMTKNVLVNSAAIGVQNECNG